MRVSDFEHIAKKKADGGIYDVNIEVPSERTSKELLMNAVLVMVLFAIVFSAAIFFR